MHILGCNVVPVKQSDWVKNSFSVTLNITLNNDWEVINEQSVHIQIDDEVLNQQITVVKNNFVVRANKIPRRSVHLDPKPLKITTKNTEKINVASLAAGV